jgi:4'-phosphopantetheinyl transferase EntD
MMRADVRSLFPGHIEGVDSLGMQAIDPLFPEEEAYLTRAVDKRRVEFASGRTCARRALAKLGVTTGALVPLPDRSVPWPDGTVGSITHAQGYVAAVVCRTSQLRGIGIDAELKGRVHEHLWKQIADDAEQAWFRAGHSEAECALRATLCFSGKEAFYKAQFCVSRAWVGFHDVTFCAAEGRFSIVLRKDIASFAKANTAYEGQYVITDDHVVSALCIA